MTESSLNILKVFKAVLVNNKHSINPKNVYLDEKTGVVTSFLPDTNQLKLFKQSFPSININVLFKKSDINKGDILSLISKQFVHYFEIYGVGIPFLFNLEQSDGTIITLKYISELTKDELTDKIHEIIYSNKPIKYLDEIVNIIKSNDIPFEFSKLKNNEIKILLYDDTHKFTSGDDVVRYMVFKTTGKSLLIKNKETIDAIKNFISENINNNPFNENFFTKHSYVLSEVFNRFKPLILAAKTYNTRSIINKISRMSKFNHVPIEISLVKDFIYQCIKTKNESERNNLYKIMKRDFSNRDLFKLLNYIEYKNNGLNVDIFKIRNGKVFIRKDRKILPRDILLEIQNSIIGVFKIRYAELYSKNIILDKMVDYGLPVSEKQTLGNLTFGTQIAINNKISTGIYWKNKSENSFVDLDLSGVTEDGERRYGWGTHYAYDKNSDVIYSGDITNAPNGAMEFLTTNTDEPIFYILCVNAFRGEMPLNFELIIGTTLSEEWIDEPIIREKSTLKTRGNIIGFVKDKKFHVYQGSLNNHVHNIYSENSPLVNYLKNGNFWTLKRLFDSLDIKYDTEKKGGKNYDINLNYNEFSLDKLNFLL